jgi:excisionase family DNA binding protein
MDFVPDRLAVSIEDAAQRTGLGRDAMYALIHAGRVPAIKVGRRYVVPIKGLEAAMDRLADEFAEEIARRPSGRSRRERRAE